ncbi:hypothetical protein [Solidesulfovibrio alcoholivorans]|uniref:hypothetical protein n=1 Tax=Solidesulfovibrio alcoholivorans TaxID=81406 RepID=UPI0012ECA96D|nr:hypothetical protein [Solidesulfovibrio alcoholivorans]
MEDIFEVFESETYEDDVTHPQPDDYELNTDDLEPGDYEDEIGDRAELLAEILSESDQDID